MDLEGKAQLDPSGSELQSVGHKGFAIYRVRRPKRFLNPAHDRLPPRGRDLESGISRLLGGAIVANFGGTSKIANKLTTCFIQLAYLPVAIKKHVELRVEIPLRPTPLKGREFVRPVTRPDMVQTGWSHSALFILILDARHMSMLGISVSSCGAVAKGVVVILFIPFEDIL